MAPRKKKSDGKMPLFTPYDKVSERRTFKPVFIDEIEIFKCRCEVDLHFSFGHVREVSFLVCSVRTGLVTGYGEVLSDDYEALKKGAAGLLGKDVTRLDAILPASSGDEEDARARECLSMAIYDACAKNLLVPLHVLLGGKRRETVELMPMLFGTSAEDASKKALKLKSDGFTSARVKIFGDRDGDVSLLQAVRKAVGKEFFILADANQGYKSVSEAAEACERFDKVPIEVIEDPLEGRARDYAKLRRKIKAKLMVSALSNHPFKELRAVIDEGSADMVNHNPCQMSSLSEALRVNYIVEGFGLTAHVGGVGFFGIGTAAYQQLASVIGLSLPCGEVGGWIDHGYPGNIVRSPYTIQKGRVKIPDTPGVGVELDKNKIQKYLETSETIK
jgi:muconate cycloisomerase